MPISLLVASPDENFREHIRESLLNIPNSKIIAAYPEVSTNLYIRVLQDLERNPEAALVMDLAADPEAALKALERVKQAAPDLYAIVSNFHADGETVIASVRAGANDFLTQPIRRQEFRDVMARLEKAPRRVVSASSSRLGKVYSFLGAKGGVGTTTLAVNFAAMLAQEKQQTVLVDLDFTANDCAMHLGVAPQHSLEDVGENLARLDQALFEGFVTRDPLGFFLVGPADQAEHRTRFTEEQFRPFADFLVEKYEATVIDAGRWLTDQVAAAALETSSNVFLVTTQRFPSIRNAQRFISALMRLGFTQDQLRIVVNEHSRKPDSNSATLDQIEQTLNQKIFASIPFSTAAQTSLTRGRPFMADRANGEIDRAFRAFVEKAAGLKAPAAAKSA